MWFCIPFTLATTMGLSALALDLPITIAEAGQGDRLPTTCPHLPAAPMPVRSSALASRFTRAGCLDRGAATVINLESSHVLVRGQLTHEPNGPRHPECIVLGVFLQQSHIRRLQLQAPHEQPAPHGPWHIRCSQHDALEST